MIDNFLKLFGAQFFLGLLQAKDPERADLIFLWVWILRLDSRPDFTAERAFDKGLKGCFAANS